MVPSSRLTASVRMPKEASREPIREYAPPGGEPGRKRAKERKTPCQLQSTAVHSDVGSKNCAVSSTSRSKNAWCQAIHGSNRASFGRGAAFTPSGGLVIGGSCFLHAAKERSDSLGLAVVKSPSSLMTSGWVCPQDFPYPCTWGKRHLGSIGE